jgi:hypothetical protein
MSNEEKQIANLKKQNEGMETAFKNKNIPFTKLSNENIIYDTELLLLKEYNNYLKGISAANRQPSQEKIKVKEKEQVKEHNKRENDDENEIVKEVKPVFSTITDMDDIKRAFFNKEYETFHTLVNNVSFKYYKATYKYANDNTGCPSFVAKNLLRGFIQNLDDYRKYLMVGFRCVSYSDSNNVTHYEYPSYWIVNSNDELKTILGSLYDDFEFNEITNDIEKVINMLHKMRKNEDEMDNALVGEVYLH